MKEPKQTVVMITTARVVVTTRPLSLNASSPVSSGILSTRPKAMAPRIIPPYEMKSSSRNDTSGVFEHTLKRLCTIVIAMSLPVMIIAVIHIIKVGDQT